MPKRALLAVAAGTAIILVTAGSLIRPAPRLVWNASASAPEGLYAVVPTASIGVGAMVIARVPERYRSLAAARHYIPRNVPLVKQVAAGPGDQICALGRDLYRNGIFLATRRAADGMGRALPGWQGCVRLRDRQYFLLMAAAPLSFDRRYFGPSDRKDILGQAHLLWAR